MLLELLLRTFQVDRREEEEEEKNKIQQQQRQVHIIFLSLFVCCWRIGICSN
jgi:hypothetical protein